MKGGLVLTLGVAAVCAVVLVSLAAQSSSSGTRSRPLVSEAQYEAWQTQLSNWGRWGADDQLGTLNLITPAKRKAALALVKEGVPVSLSTNTFFDKVEDVPCPAEWAMTTATDTGATDRVAYESSKGKINGYLARPKEKGKRPAVIVIHQNRGLNPHIEDIARRIAVDNYIAFAPDALAPLGGYPGDEDQARELFTKLDQTKTREDFVAAANWLKARPDCTGKIGAVGFCYGGGIVNMLATRLPDLGAAVPFYGNQPSADDAAKITAPMLIHYAEHDDRINAGWPAFEAALKANHVSYQEFTYPGTQHGFNNDTTPRYDAGAAKLAWSRTMEFFARHLR